MYALSASKAIYRARKVFILIQPGVDDDDNDGKKKGKKETENRKPLVTLYDRPGIQQAYSMPRPMWGLASMIDFSSILSRSHTIPDFFPRFDVG